MCFLSVCVRARGMAAVRNVYLYLAGGFKRILAVIYMKTAYRPAGSKTQQRSDFAVFFLVHG